MTDLSMAHDGIYFPAMPMPSVNGWHTHKCAWCPNTIDCAASEEDCDLTDVCLDCQVEISWKEFACE